MNTSTINTTVPRFDMFPVTQQCVLLEFKLHYLVIETAFRRQAARKPNNYHVTSSALDHVRAAAQSKSDVSRADCFLFHHSFLRHAPPPGEVQLQAGRLCDLLHQHRRSIRQSLPGKSAGIPPHRQDQGVTYLPSDRRK